jgi:hypothetical protein
VALLPSTVEELQRYGLPVEIVDALAGMVTSAWPEESVVHGFLHALSEGQLASHFGRGVKRLIVSNWKRQASDPLLTQRCVQCLSCVEPEVWNWTEYVGPNSALAKI